MEGLHTQLNIDKYKLLSLIMDNGLTCAEASEKVGKGDTYISSCISKGSISFEVARKLYKTIGIKPKSYITDDKKLKECFPEFRSETKQEDVPTQEENKCDSDSETRSEKFKILITPTIKHGLDIAAEYESMSRNNLINVVLMDYLNVMNGRGLDVFSVDDEDDGRDDLSQK